MAPNKEKTLNIHIEKMRIDEQPNRFVTSDIIYKMAFALKNSDGDYGVNHYFVEALANFDCGVGDLWILRDKGNPIAFALILSGEKNELEAPHLHLFSVLPNHQKKGYGETLLKHILEQHTDLSIEAKEHSEHFFSRFGFYRKKIESIDPEIVTMHYGPNEHKEYFPKISVEAGSQAWNDYIEELEILMKEYRRMKAS
jgi:N-acetylglutamate synthase-like GNAT family acetyltransferase